MKHNWEYKRLGDVCLVIGGSTPRTDIPEFWNGEYNWFTPAEIDESKYFSDSARKITESAVKSTGLTLLPIGTVLLTSRAPIGKLGILTKEAYCNQGFKNLVCKDELYNEYLFYALLYLKEEIQDKGRGATFKEISKKVTESIEIPVPPRAIQERIVAELDDINSMIEAKREQQKQLDLLAQSVFYTMFGDPVTNPKGWEESKLIECIANGSSISYGIVQPGEDFPNGVPVVRPIDLTGGKYVKRDYLKIVDPAISDSYKRTILLGNEILMCVRGTTGIIRMADLTLKDANVTRGITPLRVKGTINITYMYEYLKRQKAQEFIKYYTKGTTLKQINMADLRNLPILLPPLDLQQQFAAKVEAIEAQKAEIEATIKELQTLLDSRMDYWFN